MLVSIQLYSLREQIKSFGLEAVLSEVKKAGYDAVETAGFYDLQVSEFKNILDKYSLGVSGTHTALNEIIDNPDGILSMAKTLKTKNIIVPYLSENDLNSDYILTQKKLQKASDFLRSNGLVLAYHNHDHEFKGSDELLKLSKDVQGIMLELDLFWLVVAGYEPKSYFLRCKNSVLTFHLKELSALGKDMPNPLFGNGVCCLNEAVNLAKEGGFDHVVVEVENLDIDYKEYIKHACSFIKNIINSSN